MSRKEKCEGGSNWSISHRETARRCPDDYLAGPDSKLHGLSPFLRLHLSYQGTALGPPGLTFLCLSFLA